MHPVPYVANPNSPLERRYAAAAYGQSNELTTFLGSIGSQSVIDLMNHPAMQARLDQVQMQCKEQAKIGVTEWMRENWGYLVAGGGVLIGLNYFMLVAGVVPLVRSRRNF